MAVLRAAGAGEPVPDPARWGLGPGDNPIWPGMFEASALACGGSIRAAELVAQGEVARAFAFAGGLHHAMPDRASGFCYLNDAVLAILALRRHGLRVAYVDIDAHHGDGVQAAFYRSADVLTVSTHERGDRLFPGTGAVEELGEGPGRGFALNLPLNPYTDDGVYLDAFDAVVPPAVRAFEPDVIVAQLGIDGHRTDPLTHLALSIDGFTEAVRRILQLAPRVVAPSSSRTDTRLSAGSEITIPAPAAKMAKVGVSFGFTVVVTLGDGAARHWPLPGLVWQTVRTIGSGTPPVSATTVMAPIG